MAKSQSGTNAAILIAIIAALIIVYIIFLPSEERLELIGDNSTDSENDTNSKDMLLNEREITMNHINEDEIVHDFPAINLYSTTESTEIKEINSIYVKNGIFDKQDNTVQFKIKDPDNIKNVMLSFDAMKSQGVLTITLNGHEVYSGDIDKVNIDPIKLPLDLLAENNELTLQVSGVGVAFWSTNEYLLENFKITGDITDKSTTETDMTFIVPRSESSNIEKAKMQFNPECQANTAGILEILVNNQLIYSSVPDCGSLRPLEFASAIIITGENKVTFRASKGRFLIDNIKVTTKLRDTPSYTYYFDLDNEQIRDIQNTRKKANLTFFFADDTSDKEAEIFINNGKTYMPLNDEFYWSTNINRFLEEGSNSIKIVPEKDMDVRKLQIKLQNI